VRGAAPLSPAIAAASKFTLPVVYAPPPKAVVSSSSVKEPASVSPSAAVVRTVCTSRCASASVRKACTSYAAAGSQDSTRCTSFGPV
jgi:hypothetical protein